MLSESRVEKFFSKVAFDCGDCWEWTGTKNSWGYGRFLVDGRRIMAHRVCYEILVGKIPEGLVIDHLCRNHACVNPAHIEALTQLVNARRGRNIHREKTHCVRGHEYTEENTRVMRMKDGYLNRKCKNCEQRRWIEIDSKRVATIKANGGCDDNT